MTSEELSRNPAYLAKNLTLRFTCWKSVSSDVLQGRRQHLTQRKKICVKNKSDKKKLNVILKKKKTHKTQCN